jgi:hypothetical protein
MGENPYNLYDSVIQACVLLGKQTRENYIQQRADKVLIQVKMNNGDGEFCSSMRDLRQMKLFDLYRTSGFHGLAICRGASEGVLA